MPLTIHKFRLSMIYNPQLSEDSVVRSSANDMSALNRCLESQNPGAWCWSEMGPDSVGTCRGLNGSGESWPGAPAPGNRIKGKWWISRSMARKKPLLFLNIIRVAAVRPSGPTMLEQFGTPPTAQMLHEEYTPPASPNMAWKWVMGL